MDRATPLKRPRTQMQTQTQMQPQTPTVEASYYPCQNHLPQQSSHTCWQDWHGGLRIHITDKDNDNDNILRGVLSELKQAINPRQRVHSVQCLLRIVGYDPSTRLCRCHASVFRRLVAGYSHSHSHSHSHNANSNSNFNGNCIHLLCLQLGYALGRRNSPELDIMEMEMEIDVNNDIKSINDENDQVFWIVTALDVFYRYCPELVEDRSFRTATNASHRSSPLPLPFVSSSEVLRLSQEALEMGLERSDPHRKHAVSTSTSSSVCCDTPTRTSCLRWLLPIVSLWHSCSSCGLGTMLLLKHPGTLPAIHRILLLSSSSSGGERSQRQQVSSVSKRQQQQQQQQQSLSLSCKRQQFRTHRVEIINECLGLLKNLSYFGEDHRPIIVQRTPQLLETLTTLTDVPCDKTRERLSAVFRNLSLSADVRSDLAARASVLTAMVRMASNSKSGNSKSGAYQHQHQHQHQCRHHETGSGNNSSCQKNTLRNVLSTIANLAIDASTNHRMVFHGDGILVEQLLQFLIGNTFDGVDNNNNNNNDMNNDFVLRKRAARALRLLARDPSAASFMVVHHNEHNRSNNHNHSHNEYLNRDPGCFQKPRSLLEALSDRARNDPNESVREEAAEAFCACADSIRAGTMPEQHGRVLDVLTGMLSANSSAAIQNPNQNLNLNSNSIPARSNYIHYHQGRGNGHGHPIRLEIVARALKEQASHPENRAAMIRRTDLLRALAGVIRSGDASLGAKESVCAALLHLSEEDEHGAEAEVEAEADPIHSVIIVLGALVEILVDRPELPAARASALERAPVGNHNENDQNIANVRASVDAIVTGRIREFSVRTILNLAGRTSRANRKRMAQQTALIQSLLRFAGATTTGENLKKQVKAVILQLAAEL